MLAMIRYLNALFFHRGDRLAVAPALALCVLLTACGGGKLRANLTTEERLTEAMKLFEKHDYFEARTQFRIITLNAPGSAIVDKAQFYLAECHFHMDEFIIAGEEYKKLLRLYPQSEYLDDAQFKIGLAYFKLSPKSDLDQKYTWSAIEELQRFMEDYPQSDLRDQVESYLAQVRNKLAKKDFDVADLYRKLAYYESALVYFDEVLARFYDTKYAEPALFYKADILYKLAKYDEARDAIHLLQDKYRRDANQAQPGSEAAKPKFQARASDLLKLIEAQMSANGSAKK
ncbi:MAG: outer membrane protein assembly factor BamD [candidate division KSB1 bacterium]